MRIFLDANILFSAAKSDGAIRRLVGLLIKDGHALCADGYVVEEARRNLAAKFPGGLTALEAIVRGTSVSAWVPSDALAASVLSLPDKDRPVLAAAIRMKCDVLLTGDRTHFGSLYGKKVGGVIIHSPRSLALVLLV